MLRNPEIISEDHFICNHLSWLVIINSNQQLLTIWLHNKNSTFLKNMKGYAKIISCLLGANKDKQFVLYLSRLILCIYSQRGIFVFHKVWHPTCCSSILIFSSTQMILISMLSFVILSTFCKTGFPLQKFLKICFAFPFPLKKF